MKKLLAGLKSMKLAIALVSYFAAACVLATLVPQGRESEFYFEAYPKLFAELLVQSGFTRFFSSLLFLLPSLLFFANLAACAIDRFLRELRKSARRRHGPDILHLGLLFLVVGAVVSFSVRQEGFVTLGSGDAVELPDGRVVMLKAFDYLTYDDGRPRDWISTVSVMDGEKIAIEAFPIRVNHPLKLGGLSIYQVSHSAESVLAVKGSSGAEHLVARGAEIEAEGAKLFFMAEDDGEGKLVLRVTDGSGARVLRASPGESAGPFQVVAMRDRELSGLQAVGDPGYGLVLAALCLSAIGLALTFVQKLGEMKA